MATNQQSAGPRWVGVAAGLIGALWALVLLPPQLVEWGDPPGWARRLNDTAPYVWLAERLAEAGVTNRYAFWGAAAAVSFVLIGVALWRGTRLVGRWGSATSVITLVGAPVVVTSYLAENAPHPWRYLWGSEIFILLAIGLVGLVAGIVAVRRLTPRWWGVLLAATLVFIAVGTVAFTYYPHGSLVGLGVEAAILCAVRPTVRDTAAGTLPAPVR